MNDDRNRGGHPADSGKFDPSVDRSGPYEYLALDNEPGFWAEKWAEFKRLFIMLAWENEQARMTIILGSVGFLLAMLWAILFE